MLFNIIADSELYCASKSLIRTCGPDLLSARNTSCELPTPDCMNGMCTCLNVCVGACRDLTKDAEHCGNCGHSCYGGECSESVCHAIELARDDKVGQSQLAQDDERLYWTSRDGVAFVAKSGGSIQMLVRRNQASGGIAVDASNVYWSDKTSGVISKVSRAGGNPVDIATGLASDQLAINGTYLYVASSEKGIQKIPLSGGAPQLVASNEGYVSSMVANEQFLYWTGLGSIMRASVADGSVLQAASNASASRLALNATDLFWVQSGSLMRLSLAGGQPRAVLSTSGETIAADSGYVYTLGYELSKLSIRDVTAETLVRQRGYGSGVLDDTNIYWMDGERVFKFRK